MNFLLFLRNLCNFESVAQKSDFFGEKSTVKFCETWHLKYRCVDYYRLLLIEPSAKEVLIFLTRVIVDR